MIYGNSVGGIGLERTYILVDDDGNEYAATLVDTETVFDATENDIRLGKVAATQAGVTEGTKEIPPYYTVEGYRVVTNGAHFVLPVKYYEYTKLQAIFCPFNTTMVDSVAAEKVALYDRVYPVRSTEAESDVSIDTENAWIDFGFSNDSGGIYLIRYILYKEIY